MIKHHPVWPLFNRRNISALYAFIQSLVKTNSNSGKVEKCASNPKTSMMVVTVRADFYLALVGFGGGGTGPGLGPDPW